MIVNGGHVTSGWKTMLGPEMGLITGRLGGDLWVRFSWGANWGSVLHFFPIKMLQKRYEITHRAC